MERHESLSVLKIADRIPDEATAYLFLEELRWGRDNENQVCPHCQCQGVHIYIRPLNGTDRKTRTGSNSQRRVWKCRACRKQFSVLTGTIFHGSKIPVRTWIFVIFEMCSNKNGIAAREIERRYDLTAKSAWYMLHRLREAMKRDPLAGMLSGVIVADEAFIGGKPKNKHQQGKRRAPVGKSSQKAQRDLKTAVFSLIDTETGEVRSRVVPDVTGPTLKAVLAENVDIPASTLYTDAASQYRVLGQEFAAHESVDHYKKEYVRGAVTTNHAEGYFSQLKRSIDGTHHHVSRTHLDRYLAEFDFRYSTRELSDTARMRKMLGQVDGRRLSYRPLTGL